MTNEELAARAKRGNRQALEALWLAVEPFVWKQAWNLTLLYQADCAVSVEDLVQSGYFAMVKALKTFDHTGKKSFIGWLRWYLTTEFCAVCGYSQRRHAYDPTRTAKSLDAPLTDDTETTMIDLLSNPDASQDMAQAEDRALLSAVRIILERELERLPGKRGDVLRLRYFHGLTLQEAADRLEITRQRAQQLEREALDALRENNALLPLCALLQYPQPKPKPIKPKKRKRK